MRAARMAGLSAGLVCVCLTSLALPAQARHAWTDPRVLRIGTLIEPNTLNPVTGTLLPESRIDGLLFDGLVRIDARGRPIPDLATAVPSRANGGISADNRTLTYHLDPRARWHDGVPVTADDVIFTWHAIMNPNNNVGTREGYQEIAGITAPDPHTVRIQYKLPYAPALFLFADNIQGAIVPKHLLQQYADLNHVPFNGAPVGSGPYVLRTWNRGNDLIFEANAAYFRGAPHIPRIDLRIVPDTNTILTLLHTHEIDLSDDFDPTQVRALRGIDGAAITIASSNGYRHLSFNTRRAPLDDARVRRALAYASDTDAIYNKIYFGIGARAPADQNPAGGWADPALHAYPHDLARADALLAAAGWLPGPDGIRVKGGKRLTLGIVSVAGAKSNEAIEVMLQAAWREAGVELTIKNFAGATIFATMQDGGLLYNGNYDVALFSFFRNPDPNDQATMGPASIPPAGRNASFFADAELGRLQEAGIRTFDPARRHAIYDRIQRIIVRDVPIYTLVWVPIIDAYNSDLHGIDPSPLVDTWNVTSWTL
jgi:peptide/nickel transport system substrate-binding protein